MGERVCAVQPIRPTGAFGGWTVNEVRALLDVIRPGFQRLSPMLAADGWTRDEIEELNEMVLAHRDAADVAGLQAVQRFVEVKLAELEARPDIAYAVREARLVAICPQTLGQNRPRKPGHWGNEWGR